MAGCGCGCGVGVCGWGEGGGDGEEDQGGGHATGTRPQVVRNGYRPGAAGASLTGEWFKCTAEAERHCWASGAHDKAVLANTCAVHAVATANALHARHTLGHSPLRSGPLNALRSHHQAGQGQRGKAISVGAQLHENRWRFTVRLLLHCRVRQPLAAKARRSESTDMTTPPATPQRCRLRTPSALAPRATAASPRLALMTGQLPCSDPGSKRPSGLMLQNSTASPWGRDSREQATGGDSLLRQQKGTGIQELV